MTTTTAKVSPSCTCPSRAKKQAKNSSVSLLGGFLLALIPKCHFCILAYSSAITVCGKGTYYDHTPAWTSYISIGLAVTTLFFVAANKRGRRTYYALALVLLGICLIAISELYTGEMMQYNLGALVLILGVWINASFLHIYRRYFVPLAINLKKKFMRSFS